MAAVKTVESVQEVAEIASTWFETATRSDGSEDRYTRTKVGAPEWVTQLVYDAHGDFLPDDWRYDCIRAAVDWIEQALRLGEELDAGEFADAETDVYNGRLVSWLGSNLNRGAYVDEAMQEFGVDPEKGIYQMIALGQYMEASEVFGSVLASLEALVDEEIEAAK